MDIAFFLLDEYSLSVYSYGVMKLVSDAISLCIIER